MQNDDFTFKGVAPYGMRYGTITPKGKGYFGELKRPDGLPQGAIDTGTLENWSDLNFPWKCLI